MSSQDSSGKTLDPAKAFLRMKNALRQRWLSEHPRPVTPRDFPDYQNPLFREPERREITSEPVVAAEPIESPSKNNVNIAQKIDFPDGQAAVFKPRDGETVGFRKGVPDDTLYLRETAASLVADVLGMGDLVPTTTVRTVGHLIGSAQEFVPGGREARAFGKSARFDSEEDAARAAFFDYLIGHADRHSENWLLKDGKLVLIDNGFSFPVLYRPEDFKNREFLNYAARRGLPIPRIPVDWDAIQRVMTDSGLEPESVLLARRRFVDLTSGRYQTFDQLPAFFAPGGTLGDYADQKEGEISVYAVQDSRGMPLRYSEEDEQRGFEAAIDENPLESLNHHAYADWLDEHGQPEEAAFRRSLGRWLGRGNSIISPGKSPHTVNTWAVNREDLPSGVRGEDVPVWERAEHHGDPARALQGWGQYHWMQYRHLEDALRRAFMANLERNRPKTTREWGRSDDPDSPINNDAQDSRGNPLEYDEPDATSPQDVEGRALPSTPVQPVVPKEPSRGVHAPVPELPVDQFRVQQNLEGMRRVARAAPDPKTAMINYLVMLAPPRLAGVMKHFGVDPNDPDSPRKVAEHVEANGYTPRPKTELPEAVSLGTGQNRFADFVMAARHASRDAVEFNGKVWDALRGMPPDEKAQALDAFGVSPGEPLGEVQLLDRAWNWANNPANFPPPAETQTEAGGPLDSPEREQLRQAPVALIHPLELGEKGANASFKMVFQDGTAGVFKPVMGEEPGLRRGVEQWGQGKREVASSVVADILGFGDLVPPTTLRVHEGKEGSLQRFMPGTKAAAITPHANRYDGDEDLARAAVLDYILGNTDRHSGNWLVQNSDTPQAKLVLIDNGLTFPHTNVLSDFAARNHMFWNAAAGKNLPLPDLSRMAGKWPEAEAALKRLRLDDEAIALAKKRYDWVMSGRFATIGDLPAYYLEDPVYPERPDKPLPPLRSTIF